MAKKKTGAKKPKLGSGKRFKQVAASAAKSGARDPNAVAGMTFERRCEHDGHTTHDRRPREPRQRRDP